jgi:hypothetical protein
MGAAEFERDALTHQDALYNFAMYLTLQELLNDLVDDHEVRPGDYPARWFED